MAIFLIFGLWANPARNDRFFEILDKKECFSDKKSQVLKKCNISKFSTVVKNGHFSHVCFLVFWIEKNAF